MHSILKFSALCLVLPLAACGTKDVIGATGGPHNGPTFAVNSCAPKVRVTLSENQAALMDCSAGGTTVTFTGGGASYLVATQFAGDVGTLSLNQYTMASGTPVGVTPVARPAAPAGLAGAGADGLPAWHPNYAQMAADQWLRARGRQMAASGSFRGMTARVQGASSSLPQRVPPLGSTSQFKVLSNFTSGTFATVGAKLAYVGTNILLYIDTLAPQPGFTPTDLSNFGKYFDSTLFDIDTTAFGSPSDVDGNGRLIMLMSQVVNADTPTATCANQGFVAGFFNEEDFNGPADPNSNHGEIFYAIVPDTNAVYSCSHGVGGVGESLAPTFMHELQHLINFSQHAVIHGGSPLDSWLDEGLSIIAEEQGSLYHENKCGPPGAVVPGCYGSASQIFPDSSQGFIQNFFYDGYQYALLPDTSSITKHDDAQGGFAWRGGAWLISRYVGDHYGQSAFRTITTSNTASATANIAAVAGLPFATVFANMGLALFTDSMPGLGKTTAPLANRFTTRSLRKLWARLFTTTVQGFGGPTADVPRAMPIIPASISGDTTTFVMQAGTMAFWRLDTPAADSTVTVRFSTPAGTALSGSLTPQLAIYRLPAGQ